MAMNPLDGLRPTGTGSTGDGGERPLSGANAGDVDRMRGLMRTQGPTATGGNVPSIDEIKSLFEMKDQAAALRAKGASMTAAEKTELARLDGELNKAAAKYPPSPEDARRLTEINQKIGALEARQNRTPQEQADLDKLRGDADAIRFKAYERQPTKEEVIKELVKSSMISQVSMWKPKKLDDD